jgi:hypothetical protein
MLNGDDAMRTTTSLLPSKSTATISCVPQSENQSRSSCQRGDSPKTMPVINVCGSGTVLLISSGTRVDVTLFLCFVAVSVFTGSVSVGEEPGQHRYERLGGHDMFLALQDTVPSVG